jgi:hypothetical protein
VISTQARNNQQHPSFRSSPRARVALPPPSPSMTQPGVLGDSWTPRISRNPVSLPRLRIPSSRHVRCTQLRVVSHPYLFFWVGLRTTTHNVVLHVYPQPAFRGFESRLGCCSRMQWVGAHVMLPSHSFLALSTLLCAPRPDRV